MYYFVIVIALVVAIIDWFAVRVEWKILEYIAKPAVIVLLIAWLLINGGYYGPAKFFLIGLLLSLAGDIFLMLPEEIFIAGLVSFLLAHLAYIRGFSFSGIILSIGLFLVFSIVGLAGFVVLRQILKGLTALHQEKMRFPVILYALVISVMLITAIATLVSPSSGWDFYPAILVSVGAFLFFLSDSILAWNRFVHLLPHGKLLVISFYHLAQITITMGAGLNFLS